MTRKTKYVGLESGKSSATWFTPHPSPVTGDGHTTRRNATLKLIFQSANGKKI